MIVGMVVVDVVGNVIDNVGIVVIDVLGGLTIGWVVLEN